MNKLQSNLLWRALLCTFLLFSIAACSSDDEAPAAAGNAASVVRIINAIPDAPTFGLSVGDEIFGTAAFGQTSSEYTSSAGETVTVNIVYQTTDSETEIFLENLSVNTGDDREIYILLTGTFASPNTSLIDNEVAALELDANGTIITSTSLGVQFGNSVNNGQAVDIYLTETDEPLSTATPVSTLSFDGVSTLLPYTAGTDYRIRITAVGSSAVIYDSGTISLEATRNQIFMLIDYFGPGSSPFRIVSIARGTAATITTEQLPSELRVANFISNNPSVDFYFGDTNDAPEFSGVTFGEYTAYMDFEAGLMSINVTPNGESTNFLHEQNVNLIAGQSRTLYLAGNPGSDNGVGGRIILDNHRPIATELQLRFLHAASESGAVDFYVLDSDQSITDATADVEGATFLGNTNIPVALGTYDLVATEAGGSVILAGPTRISVNIGIYSIILSDSPNGGAPYAISVREEFFD